MRLINVLTGRLESFTSMVPRYAILSHTWGADGDEVTFQEMLVEPEDRLPRTTSKPGYEKILKTCEIAKSENKKLAETRTNYHGLYHKDDGIRYVWIDTCCIDKGSSAELSEAINSMYNYYREADVCLAYLSDMTTDPETFGTSRWFTRGWTLQELIAPSKVYFYDWSWTYRGDRVSFQETIRTVTHIATFKNILDLPVAVRMSWASNRETTRVEDLAYCLMGIFDVNMPLLYGEGKKAFIRLQEEIIKQNPDLSIFAWIDPFPSMFSGLLAESPECGQHQHRLPRILCYQSRDSIPVPP
ncbi:HET-domain-containing protein [Karstenula rhodostoma CBS 690.94]|uniref:HET-domain-containing protein n=1 Tax=Karstenula rhodostoma CBS 690.94 TaxID=1392251 RepID=A0A9P4P5N1_9PLEO|nr:HET-domain-containing protein [Karstenula rhodostoma CBS 690.94]